VRELIFLEFPNRVSRTLKMVFIKYDLKREDVSISLDVDIAIGIQMRHDLIYGFE
jgi:hypothetical protein